MIRILLAASSLALVTGAACKKADAPTSTAEPRTGSSDGAGSAAPTPPVDAMPRLRIDAPPPPDAAVATPDAAADTPAAGSAEPAFEDPRGSELCSQVLAKIVECRSDKAFTAALDEGADAKQRKRTKALLKEVAAWTPSEQDCVNLAANYQFTGFLDHWAKVAHTADVLASCGTLGTAIAGASGLFGGDRAY